MKFLLLAFCLGLALAQPSYENNESYPRIQETSFRPGKEYLYQYDTQILTGLPQTSTIHAGFKFSCVARVQFNTYSKIRVLFDKIFLYRINEPVVQWKPSERLMPDEATKEMVGFVANTMESFLQIPFGFEYDNGMVVKIQLDDKETTWSANIKRGFVSMFEMNLEKRFLLDKSFPSLKSPVPPHVNWYNVMERTPTGDCATLYTVTPNQKNDHLYVTKVRDFSQCLDKPKYINSIMDGVWAEDAEKDNPLVTGSTLKYSVRGNDKQFLILSVVGEGRIVFNPVKQHDEVMTTVNQTLHLRDSKLIGKEVMEIPEIHHGRHKRDTIQMTLQSRPVDCQDPFMPCREEPKQVSEEADVYSVEKLYLHLQMASRNTLEITDEESLEHLRVLKNMLKTSPVTILRKLWEKLLIERINPQADMNNLGRQIYWNTLADVGTEASANVILDLCVESYPLLANNCSYSLNRIALKVMPTTEIIKKLIKLSIMQRLTPELKQSAYLTMGSFGYKLTQEMKRQLQHCQKSEELLNTLLQDGNNDRNDFIKNQKRPIENECNRIVNRFTQSQEKIVKAMGLLLRSPKQDDKILALKSIGNSGLPATLPILKIFLENPAEPQITRIMAIVAHRRINYPETPRQEAIKTLLKLYLTTSENNEIRTMAFFIMTGLRPELPIYETVATSLRHEKDAQVSNFVYSFFSTYSNSTYHPDWPLKHNCSSAIEFAPEAHSGLYHSFLRRFGQYSEFYRKGYALSMAKVGDASRYLGATFNLDSYQYGLLSQFMEIGINTEGVSQFLNKLFGPHGLLTHNKSLFDLLRRAPRDISPQEMIQQIFKTLRIEPRTMAEIYGHVYFKMMGHELRYFDITKLMNTIATTGTYPMTLDEEGWRVGVPVDLNTMYDILDEQMTLPTEAGLPISLTYQLMSTVKIQGSVNFKVSPNMLETDRQGRPPIAIHGGIDLKPKIVTELRCSMGLDMFYLKPKVGYRGLIKYNAPIQTEVNIDHSYHRFNLKWYTPVMEKPAVEMMLEPFSEFLLINKKNRSPVFVSDRKSIYSPVGTRVMPLSLQYKLKSIGHEVSITGQLPHCLRKNNPFHPFHGRTLVNIFFKPMQNAPSVIDLSVQKVYPIRQAVTTSYAQTYQEMLTTRPEQFGRDFSRIPYSGVMKFDKYGRPLPQSTDEILPYSDPLDIQEKSVNMQQMCNKFQHIFGKPMPFYNQEESYGLVVVLDASSKTSKRVMQLETLWNSLKDGHIAHMYSRFWRSPIPEYDVQEWQLLSELGVTYPFEVKEPKDIFDPQWQRQLMKDLEYLITLESHKVVNQRMNMTILSGLEQFNYPAMIRAPTYRVLDSLVPEQLYNVMNISGSTIYNKRWDHYWRTLGPLYRQVTDEVRVNVDPFFVYNDLHLFEHLTQVLKVQDDFLHDLQDILAKTVVAHAELPVIQWINYIQTRTVYMIREIFHKALVKDLVHSADQINSLLNRAESNLDSIVSLMNQVMEKVTSVSQELDTQGKPVVVFDPEELKMAQNSGINRFYYELDHHEYPEEDFIKPLDSVKMSLYNLTHTQVGIIQKVQLAISNNRELDIKYLTHLIEEVRNNLNILDQTLKNGPIVDPVIKQSLLMVTVQNEYCITLLEQYKKSCLVTLSIKLTKDKLHLLTTTLTVMKEQGIYLGERVSMLYHRDLLDQVVVPNLTHEEYKIYREIAQIKRQLIPELREFEILLARNFTNMKKPEMMVATCDKFCERLTNHAEKITGIQKALIDLNQIPKVYLVSELMDAINYLKYTTEFGSRTLYTIHDQRRFTYLEKLSTMATKVQSLVSALSPIFYKYVELNEPEHSRMHVPILDTIPIDTHILDVQDVIVKQKMLKEQIRRFIQNPDVSSEVLSTVLNSIVDSLEVLQETLKQNKVQIDSVLEQSKLFEKQTISTFWTQALTQQRTMLEGILNIYNNRRDQLHDVVRMSERINALELQIVELEDSHKTYVDSWKQQDVPYTSEYTSQFYNKLDMFRTKPLIQPPRYEPQQKLQSLTPYDYLPTGVTALLNITWGNGQVLNKNAKAQFMASRSMEQIINLFKEMSAVLREQDIVYSVNRRLSGEPWLTETAMQKVNTFNHLHFIAEAQKEQLPQWLLDQLLYAQDLFKASFWNEYQRQSGVHFVSQNQIHAMADISDINKEWDFYLLKNTETNVYQGIKMWKWLQDYPVIQTYRPLEDKLMSHFTQNKKPTQCKVNKDNVYTFDKVSYQLPHTMAKKEALLAADCSDEKSFAITMIKSNTSFDGHTIKLISEDKVVEVIPGYLSTEVRVNGEVIVLDENKPVVFTKKLHYDLYEPHLRIVRKGWRVEVTFTLVGVHFMMEGTYTQIEISELFKRRVCGMCSNFDTQMSWEYEGPTKEIYTSAKVFAESYILREQDRNVIQRNKKQFLSQHDRYNDIMSHYRPKGGAGKFEIDEDMLTAEYDEETEVTNQCKPVFKTITKKRRSQKQICFSEKPVQKCSIDCPLTVEKEATKVKFVCVSYKTNKQMRQLLTLTSSGNTQQIKDMSTKTIEREITMAVKCQYEDF